MSSSSSLRIKQYLAKDNNTCIAILITACYTLGAPVFILGIKELYKTHTFVIGQCQIKSIDLIPGNHGFYPRWNITALHENQTKHDTLIASTFFFIESRA
jgi:hypothetical protein